MDKIFKKIIGTDVEVYVDNMVVKSIVAVDHYKALERVFQVLRRHQLKLNLEKCSFRVQAGKFLGFMLTERGIEGNPEKCQAIINMRSPWMVKEAIPIFNTLRKGDAFTWTAKSEEAFLRLKALLATPPILTRLTPDIPLLVYISIAEDVVSVAIVQEREWKQHLMYFISKVLRDAERRYQKIEKVTLTLIISSRRLRPYFQGYPIIIQMDLPIKQVLRKPDLTGRMVAWSVQLSKFDISYKNKGYIKAQALADFIVEMTTSGSVAEEDNKWFLSVDRASNQTGSKVGVILEGPNEVLIEQSLHFEFKASNNQAEYEALLAGMRLAKELEAKTLTAKSDSKLVTSQVNGEYQAKDPQLIKYLERATGMAATFKKFTLQHVPRE
ncbi:Retrovirus-related Pol polyprotein from transposon 17.6, partial [Mucuna pruriens]